MQRVVVWIQIGGMVLRLYIATNRNRRNRIRLHVDPPNDETRIGNTKNLKTFFRSSSFFARGQFVQSSIFIILMNLSTRLQHVQEPIRTTITQ